MDGINLVASCIRFAVGKELDGIPRTDASWSRRGTRDFEYRPWRWYRYSYRRRAGIRFTLILGTCLSIYGGVTDLHSWYISVLVLFWIGMAIVVWLMIHWIRKWTHYFAWYPRVAAALSERLKISRHVHPTEWIDIPPGHQDDPEKVCTIKLPSDYAGTVNAKESLAQLAADTLGLIDFQFYFAMTDEYPVLHVWTTPRPPKKVAFDEVRETCEQACETDLMVGLDADEKPVMISLELDSPHIMASIGPGGGKTNFCKSIACQALYKGFRLIIIDCVKRGSQAKWAKNIEGVEIYRHPDVAHDALIDLQIEIEARCENYWDFDHQNDQRIILIIEEANQTQRRLQSYWNNELNGRKLSPAILAIESILCVGREPKCNVLTVGQRMSAQASGGGDARENYGVRLANRFSPQTARMLFPEVDPLPKSSTHPGRVQMITGGKATEIQIPFCRSEDAVTWALAGRPVLNTSVSPEDNVLQLVRQPRLGYSHVSDEVPVGFREAVNRNLVTCSLAVLRNQRQVDPEFPDPVSKRGKGKTAEQLFIPSDLVFWEKNREKRE